jgi:hypothetical protein
LLTKTRLSIFNKILCIPFLACDLLVAIFSGLVQKPSIQVEEKVSPRTGQGGRSGRENRLKLVFKALKT